MTLKSRVIPVLLVKDDCLVKTSKFRAPRYVGSPLNTAKIFSELQADELVILDISATRRGFSPNFEMVEEIASVVSMPLCYGGGISDLEHAKRLLSAGCEKVLVNSAAYGCPGLISQIAETYGSQSVVAGLDYVGESSATYGLRSHGGRKRQFISPVDWALTVEGLGAGEILLTSINREGSQAGMEMGLASMVCNAVNIPVVLHGGASSRTNLEAVGIATGVSAFGVGSAVVYNAKNQGVLVNIPDSFRDVVSPHNVPKTRI